MSANHSVSGSHVLGPFVSLTGLEIHQVRICRTSTVVAKIGILVALKSVIYFRLVLETIGVQPIVLMSRTKKFSDRRRRIAYTLSLKNK